MTIAAHHTPMTTIKLYGALRQFGREYRMLVGSTAEAIKALCVQIPGLERFLSPMPTCEVWSSLYSVGNGTFPKMSCSSGRRGNSHCSGHAGPEAWRVGADDSRGRLDSCFLRFSRHSPVCAACRDRDGCRRRHPNAQPPGPGSEAERGAGEPAQLRLRQRQKYHSQREPGADLLREAPVAGRLSRLRFTPRTRCSHPRGKGQDTYTLPILAAA